MPERPCPAGAAFLASEAIEGYERASRRLPESWGQRQREPASCRQTVTGSGADCSDLGETIQIPDVGRLEAVSFRTPSPFPSIAYHSVAVEQGIRPPLFGMPSFQRVVLNRWAVDVAQILAHFVAL